jgi:quercetin dioxygenase-like cupin family protein
VKRNHDLEECRATAALYALGSLPSEQAERFELRLRSGCPVCNTARNDYVEVAEHLAMSAPAIEPPPSLRARILSLAKSERPAPVKPGMTIVRRDESAWKDLPIQGVEIRPLLGQKTLMVRMQPGAVYPMHEHREAEQCYVLEGSITDSDGVTANAGDFVCMPAKTIHRPIHTDTGCVFLITYTA